MLKVFLAPENNCWNYIVEKPSPDWTSSSNNPRTKAFVPGLGLRIGFASLPYAAVPGDTSSFLAQAWVLEAGTDCVGFVQRAASYDTDRHYTWRKLPKGWTERQDYAGSDDIWAQLGTYNTNGESRNYPSNLTEAQTGNGWNHVADDIISKRSETLAPVEVSTAQHLEQLKRVVPGDIWVKDGTDSDNPVLKRDHIAIVASVPQYTEGMTVEEFMDGMILIEGEFANKIQSVIKKLSVGDYNNNNLTSDRVIYQGFTLKKDQNGFSLNCQSWAIRRLK